MFCRLQHQQADICVLLLFNVPLMLNVKSDDYSSYSGYVTGSKKISGQIRFDALGINLQLKVCFYGIIQTLQLHKSAGKHLES